MDAFEKKYTTELIAAEIAKDEIPGSSSLAARFKTIKEMLDEYRSAPIKADRLAGALEEVDKNDSYMKSKVRRRHEAVHIWWDGLKANGGQPTPQLANIFNIGFNMGWEAKWKAAKSNSARAIREKSKEEKQ